MEERIAQITEGLTEAHVDFLERLSSGQRLKLADREEDRVRQKCRRLGLAWVLMKPRRWTISPLGAAALIAYRKRKEVASDHRCM